MRIPSGWTICAWLTLSAAAQACALRVEAHAGLIKGIVVGLAPPEETQRQTEIAERATGGKASPRYAPLPRILAEYKDASGQRHRTIAAVTDGQIPPPGATIILSPRHLDPANPCQFIPWTVKFIGMVS